MSRSRSHPEDWTLGRLVDRVSFPSGQVDPTKLPYREWILIAPDHIESGTGRLLGTETTEQQNAISGKYPFEKGDILYLIEKTEALIAKYQAIKQGMMHDLFTRGVDEHGHLRPPYDEAPKLYKESELGWIPKEWETPKFGDITPTEAPICYGIVQPGEYDECGTPVVAIYNLHSDLTELHRSSRKVEEKYVRSRVATGDVLISVKGPIGRVGIVPEWFEGNISLDIARIRTKSGISSEYL